LSSIVVKKSLCGVEDITIRFSGYGYLCILGKSTGLQGSTLTAWSGKDVKAGRTFPLLPGKIDPETATKAVLEYLKTNKRNISQAASSFVSTDAWHTTFLKGRRRVIQETGHTPGQQVIGRRDSELP
jgi:phosphatidylserine/phosphatidylglycerophosphate/cardiolipin synthase-like enzyme